MNVYFLYNLNNVVINELVDSLMNNINLSKSKFKMFKKDKLNIKTSSNIYIVISNEIEEIKNFFSKIKENNNTMIITDNLASSFILECANLTNSICYLKNSIEVISNRIVELYENKKI